MYIYIYIYNSKYKMAPIYGDRMLGVVCLVCVVTVFLVGRTLCVHQYDRDVLLHIRDTMSQCDMQPNYCFNDIVLPGPNWVTDQPPNASGQRVRKRGRRGGALLRLRRRNLRPPLPSMFLSNIRSLRNKTDEFLCNLQTKRYYKDCSIVCFTEAWLDATIPDSAVQTPCRGVCILVNDRWATDVKVLSKTCSFDMDTLTIVCRRFPA